jgi:hypothetical protein
MFTDDITEKPAKKYRNDLISVNVVGGNLQPKDSQRDNMFIKGYHREREDIWSFQSDSFQSSPFVVFSSV